MKIIRKTELTNELDGGLMIQTSIEYRDASNFVFRINYDDFNSQMNIEYPLRTDFTYTGKTSFSELLIGFGYRHRIRKHILTNDAQPGVRFYGYPSFEITGNLVNINFDNRSTWASRYSIGYEYNVADKIFIVVEGLASHTFKREDFGKTTIGLLVLVWEFQHLFFRNQVWSVFQPPFIHVF